MQVVWSRLDEFWVNNNVFSGLGQTQKDAKNQGNV